MSPRAFQVLLWSTVAAVIVAIFAVRSDALPDGSRVTGDASIAPFAARVADVAKIGVDAPDYVLALEKKGDAWVASDRGGYPARPSAVANLLASVAAMKLSERKTTKPELFREIGVEDRAPGASSTGLAFDYAGGAKAGAIVIGKRSSSASFDQTGSTFVRRAGENQAWLASGAPNMPREFSEWFAELPAVPATEAQRVTVSEGGRVVFDARKNDQGLYARADAAEPAANDTNVKRIAQALVGTGFEDVQPASAMTNVSRTLRVELASGHIDVTVGDVAGKPYVRFDGEAASGAAAEVIRLSKGFVYRLPAYRISGLTQTIAELTAPEATGEVAPENLPPGIMPQGMPPGMPHGLPPGFPGLPQP